MNDNILYNEQPKWVQFYACLDQDPNLLQECNWISIRIQEKA